MPKNHTQSFLIKGFDIGTSKITAIIGQYYPLEDKLNIIGISSQTSIGFKKGQMVNLEQAATTFRQVKESVERMTGTKLDKSYVSIAGQHFETKTNQGSILITNSQNEITKEHIDLVIEASKDINIPEGKEIIHVIPQKFSIDSQTGITNPQGMTGERLTVTSTIILANSTSLSNVQKALHMAGVTIEGMSYTGLCNGYIATNSTEKELGSAIVDIGGNETTVSIFQEGNLTDSFVIPMGSSNTTNDLAIGLRLPLEEAEELKQTLQNIDTEKNHEIDFKSKKINTNTAINGIIKPRLQELFSLIDENLEDRKLKLKLQAGIILCGGGSLSPNIAQIATSITRLPVKFAQLSNIGGLMEDLSPQLYISSIGLIKLQIQNSFEPITKTSPQSKFNPSSIFYKLKHLIKPLIP